MPSFSSMVIPGSVQIQRYRSKCYSVINHKFFYNFSFFPNSCLNFALLKKIKVKCSNTNYWMIFWILGRILKNLFGFFKRQKPKKELRGLKRLSMQAMFVKIRRGVNK